MFSSSAKSCKSSVLTVLTCFIAIILSIVLFTGCSSSSSSSNNVDPQIEALLTDQLTFSGVSIGHPSDWVEPSYKSNVFSRISFPNNGDQASYSGLKISTYLDRTGTDINTYSPNSEKGNGNNGVRNDVTYSLEDDWKDGPVDYAVYSGSYNVGDKVYQQRVLVAYDNDNSKSFVISADIAPDEQTDDNYSLIDTIFKTVEYNPDELIYDTADEFNKNINASKASSGNTSSSSNSFQSALNAMGSFEPSTINGSGDDVIDIPCAGKPCLMKISYSGSGNFVVKTYDSAGNSIDLLVNEIGAYEGVVSTYFNYQNSHTLEIKASGPWSITFSPLSAAQKADNGSTFHGDNVVYIDVPSISKIKFTHSGTGNFVVKAVGMNASKLLVNEIGAYDGTVMWSEPQALFFVTADGDWSVSW